MSRDASRRAEPTPGRELPPALKERLREIRVDVVGVRLVENLIDRARTRVRQHVIVRSGEAELGKRAGLDVVTCASVIATSALARFTSSASRSAA